MLAVQRTPLAFADGTTYYVSPAGNDAADCRSATTACLTIGAAIGRSAAGDTISIGAGVYHEHLSIGHNLTLTGAGAGQTIVDGSGTATGTLVTVASGVVATLSALTVQHGTTDDPTSAGGVTTAGALTLVDSVVSDNSGGGAGGIDQYGGSLTLVDSAVTANAGDVGGIEDALGTLAIISSTVNANDGNAGGIHVYNAILSLTASTVSGNNGGGIDNEGVATLTNSTVSGNIGPGLDNLFSAGLFNSTVSGNSGSGILSEGMTPVSLANSLVAGNIGPDCTGALASLGYNLLGSAASCSGLTDGVDGDRVGVDPRLAPLADNGGPTPTQALLPGSPAIDGGNPAGCQDGTGAALTTDQRGLPRPDGVNNRCDIGAYEVQQPPVAPTVPPGATVTPPPPTPEPSSTAASPVPEATPPPAPSPVYLPSRRPTARVLAPPLSYSLGSHAVAGGGSLSIRIASVAHAHVKVTLQAVKHTTVAVGKGKSRHKVKRTVVLYHTAIAGVTDAHGRYSGHLRVTYKPAKAVQALLTIDTWTTHGKATGTTNITINPPHSTQAKGGGRKAKAPQAEGEGRKAKAPAGATFAFRLPPSASAQRAAP